YDSVPAHRDRTRDRTYPKSRGDAAEFFASMPAISGKRPRWFGSRRTDRFESAPVPADSGSKTRRSTDQDHSDRRLDRFRHGASASSATTEDLCEARFRSPRDLSRT